MPDAESSVVGLFANSASRFGVFAAVTALPGPLGARPKPSIIISTAFFIRQSISVALIMAAKSSGFKDAPPIRPPSMSGMASSSAQFLAFMLPP